ncbi:AAA family ATPase [Permianibacter aggregans]|uniref:AAA ATPase-like protein n=1 Tax=Permianibacter aggregans TaxID=1510150 RepID=A0A4R6UKU6_9GAMM|nr:AAA family ATPase [Permianibacter aggregans]QGX40593.1 DUF2813 domain-containing protein [Permianibacter aggregans]TDQ43844.1 AAA ATPase-like protein [Permianibacter aggregans]
MIRCLYVDNFRGFHDSILELRKVNFFVGENSTGKSSILSLLKIISDFEFQYLGELKSRDVFLGSFKEIASKDQPITIAELMGKESEDGLGFEEIRSALMYEFRNEEGLPSLRKITFYSDQQIVTVHKDKDATKARSLAISEFFYMEDAHELMRKMRDFQNSESISGWKKIESPNIGRTGAVQLLDIACATLALKKISSSLYKRERSEIIWLAPIRAKPKRTYDGFRAAYTPEGDHAPYLLKKLLTTEKYRRHAEIIDSFGEDSGLYSNVEVNSYGKDETSPFELKVKIGRRKVRITNVGYGVSQVLPIIAEFVARGKSCYVIQQPEVHLHPRAQAALGEFIFTFANNLGAEFLIETHSDYLIDRFRLKMSEANKSRNKQKLDTDAQVVFFEKNNNGNKFTVIPVLSNGQYSEVQPRTFRDFFLKEQLSLLGI